MISVAVWWFKLFRGNVTKSPGRPVFELTTSKSPVSQKKAFDVNVYSNTIAYKSDLKITTTQSGDNNVSKNVCELTIYEIILFINFLELFHAPKLTTRLIMNHWIQLKSYWFDIKSHTYTEKVFAFTRTPSHQLTTSIVLVQVNTL